MYKSNSLARLFLINNGYDQIWLKAHTRMQDTIVCQHYNYKAIDLWNLFDGICFKEGHLYFLQIKTNAWPDMNAIQDFKKQFFPFSDTIRVLIINVKKVKRKTGIVTRLV